MEKKENQNKEIENMIVENIDSLINQKLAADKEKEKELELEKEKENKKKNKKTGKSKTYTTEINKEDLPPYNYQEKLIENLKTFVSDINKTDPEILEFITLENIKQENAVFKKEDKIHFELNRFINNFSEENEYLFQILDGLKKGGILIVLLKIRSIDSFYSNIVSKYITERDNTTFLTKSLIVEYSEKIALISLTKFEAKKKVELNTFKARIYDILFDSQQQKCTLINLLDISFTRLEKYLNYLHYLNFWQAYLDKVRPGEINSIDIRLNTEEDTIHYNLLVVDAIDIDLLEKKNILGLVINDNLTTDLYYVTRNFYANLNRELDVSRLLVIKPNFFCHHTSDEIQNLTNWYTQKFIPSSFNVDKIYIVTNQDRRQDEYEVYHDNDYYIYDTRTQDTENYYRILAPAYFKKLDKSIKLKLSRRTYKFYSAEMDITLVNKLDSKGSNIKVLPNNAHFKKRKLEVTKSGSVMDYEHHFALCSMYFLSDLELMNFKKEGIDGEVIQVKELVFKEKEEKCFLVLNSLLGELPFLFNNIHESIKVTAVEENEKLIKLGKDYFGFDGNKNLTTINENILTYLHKTKNANFEKFHIISYITKFSENVSSSPAEDFLTKENIELLYSICHSKGVICLSLRTKDQIFFESTMSIIKSFFPKVYALDSCSPVNKLIFLLKTDIEKEKILFLDLFQPNLKILGVNHNYQKFVAEEVQDLFFKKLVKIQ